MLTDELFTTASTRLNAHLFYSFDATLILMKLPQAARFRYSLPRASARFMKGDSRANGAPLISVSLLLHTHDD